MNPQGHKSEQGGHERRDADVINLALLVALLLLVMGICLLVCVGALRHLDQQRISEAGIRSGKSFAPEQFPKPNLIVTPRRESVAVTQAAKTRLATYGWVDRETGTVRIPITRAMQLLVERGLPEVGGGQTRLELMQSHVGPIFPSPSAAESPTAEAKP